MPKQTPTKSPEEPAKPESRSLVMNVRFGLTTVIACDGADGGFVRIVLKKSPFERVQDADSIGFAFPSSRQSRLWHQLGEFPKVLGGCCELKLFICAFGSS